MGCDIHLFAEVKQIQYGSIWEPIRRRVLISEYREDRYIDMRWGEGRNYDTFAMLADVRNGRGFAGCDTGDGFRPIASPKGLPDDCSDLVSRESREWGEDGHSHSWFTLRELLDLEKSGYWDQATEIRGVAHIPEMTDYWRNLIVSQDGQSLVLKHAPNSWAGGISGPPASEIYNLSWRATYRECDTWLQDAIVAAKDVLNQHAVKKLITMHVTDNRWPVLLEEGEETMDHWVDAAECFRFVFWFDN